MESRTRTDTKILRKSKEKYGVNNATITGHSLGGSIGGLIAKNNDKVDRKSTRLNSSHG